MRQLRMVEFTHANNGMKVLIVPTSVFTVYYSEAAKCTQIVSISTALFPVKESVEQVRRELESAMSGEET